MFMFKGLKICCMMCPHIAKIICLWAVDVPHIFLYFVYMWAGSFVMWTEIRLGSVISCNSTSTMWTVHVQGRICWVLHLAFVSLQEQIQFAVTMLGTLIGSCNIRTVLSVNTVILVQWTDFKTSVIYDVNIISCI